MFERIVIETESSDDSRSLFRLQVDGHLIREGLSVGHRMGAPHPRTRKAARRVRLRKTPRRESIPSEDLNASNELTGRERRSAGGQAAKS
jgi:hypothetical protein